MGMGITSILSVPGMSKFYLSQEIVKGKSYSNKFSRFDLNSGKLDWSIPNNFTSYITKYFPRVHYFPSFITTFPEKQQIMRIGISYDTNRILKLNSETGESPLSDME